MLVYVYTETRTSVDFINPIVEQRAFSNWEDAKDVFNLNRKIWLSERGNEENYLECDDFGLKARSYIFTDCGEDVALQINHFEI